MESYIKHIKSLDFTPMNPNTNCNNITSDTYKRKRDDYGLEDIRIRIENLLGRANEFVNHNKSCNKTKLKSVNEWPINPENQPRSIQSPGSRIPKRNNPSKQTPLNGAKSRSVTPQRIVQSRIKYFEALSQNKDVYKTILSQERALGIERTFIPVAVNIKALQREHFATTKVPSFNQKELRPPQEKDVFVFAAPGPAAVRSIPRLVHRKKASGNSKTVARKIPFCNYNQDTPSKIPVLDKSKFFAGESRMPINRRKTG